MNDVLNIVLLLMWIGMSTHIMATSKGDIVQCLAGAFLLLLVVIALLTWKVFP